MGAKEEQTYFEPTDVKHELEDGSDRNIDTSNVPVMLGIRLKQLTTKKTTQEISINCYRCYLKTSTDLLQTNIT